MHVIMHFTAHKQIYSCKQQYHDYYCRIFFIVDDCQGEDFKRGLLPENHRLECSSACSSACHHPVTMLDGVVVCMLVRLLVYLLRIDVWNGIEVGVEVDVDAAASRSWLAWSLRHRTRHVTWTRTATPLHLRRLNCHNFRSSPRDVAMVTN